MTRRATIHTVARAAGVSTSTVSQALRGNGRISEETRRRVLQAAEQVNYVQNRRAAAMRSGDAREIGFLINDIGNPFNAELVGGVNERLEEAGYLVYLLDSRDDPERQWRYLNTILDGDMGGLLWVPSWNTSQEIVDLVARRSPATVTLLRAFDEQVFDHVGVDSGHGTMLATRHLLDLGHRHIAFLGGEGDNTTLSQRVGGYVSALMAAGGPAPIVRQCAERKAVARDMAVQMLTDHPQITALVCNCDVVAAGASFGAAAMGRVVGRDLSITGFDDIEDAALWLPPLTTIAVDPRGIGHQLAEAYLARKANPDAPVRTVNLPVRLVVRESTGPVSEGAPHGHT